MRVFDLPTLRLTLLVGLLLLVVSGCAPTPPPDSPVVPSRRPTETPGAVRRIEGQVTGASAGGVPLALCEVNGAQTFPLACTVTGVRGTTAPDGSFTFEGVTPGVYALLVDSGLGDFPSALDAWQGRTLIAGEWPWLRDEFFGLAEGDPVRLNLPPDLDYPAPTEYALNTLQLGGSPFVLAHTIEERAEAVVLRPALADLRTTATAEVTFARTRPQPPDLVALRSDEALGPLTAEESALLAPEVAERWAAFLAGDDDAFREADVRLVRGLREGTIYQIGNTLLTTQEVDGDTLVKRIAYEVRDGSGAQVVGWLDEATRDVIEVATGYKLNVRDNPGEGTVPGPNGEQFYVYGFSYYRRWERILADPIIAMARRFYQLAPSHITQWAGAYADANAANGGDLRLIRWDASLPQEIAEWRPAEEVAPTLILPDSGTVDVRRERFLQAVIDGQVTVNRDSVLSFIRTDPAQFNGFIENPDPQEVIDALLTPYRSGHLFNDMEAALILSATYDGEEPLEISISSRLEAGFMVPRRSNSTVLVAPEEVGYVILGYGGTLNARWPHEMAHVVEFRAPQYEWVSARGGLSACEPLKYMLEFMWWVERYPYDAPAEDWMPIGSGLTLSRLLTDTYPNSGC